MNNEEKNIIHDVKWHMNLSLKNLDVIDSLIKNDLLDHALQQVKLLKDDVQTHINKLNRLNPALESTSNIVLFHKNTSDTQAKDNDK